MRPDDAKLIRVNHHLNKKLLDDLSELADIQGKTVSEIIRTLLHPAVKAELKEHWLIEAAKLKVKTGGQASA